MAFKLAVPDVLHVPVAGSYSAEDGAKVKFDFVLLCKRLNQTEISEVMKNQDESVLEFLQKVSTGWAEVLDDSGDALPFSADNLNAVLEQPGMSALCFGAYMAEIGVKSKI